MHYVRILFACALLMVALAGCGGNRAATQPVATVQPTASADDNGDGSDPTDAADVEATPQPTTSDAEQAGPTVAALTEGPTKATYAVGDVARVGPFRVRINNVKTATTSDAGPANAGDQFLLLNLTIENATDQDQDLSLLFQVLRDNGGTNYQLDPGASMNAIPTMDGRYHAHVQQTGVIGYQVPTAAKNLSWLFTLVQSGSGQTMTSTQATFAVPTS